MKEQLRQNVFGQRSAIDRIASLLHNHVENMGNYKRLPLVLHFAGDNGVGKSMSADIVSEYLFKFHIGRPIEERKALLYQNAENYKYGDAEELSDNLKRLIIKQIRKCRNSIIYLEDISKMQWRVLASLEPFFSGLVHYNNEEISTRDLIFILTSDLGKEDLTRDYTMRQLVNHITNEMYNFVPNKPVFHSYIRHVPFVSLDNATIWAITKKELDHLVCENNFDSVEYSKEVVDYLVAEWWSDKTARAKNGRGVKGDIILDFVQHVIQEALDKTTLEENLILILTMKENKIHATIRSNYNKQFDDDVKRDL